MSHEIRLLFAGLLLLAATVFFVQGCGQYDTVNATTYEHAKALYSACNRRDRQRLEVCANMIAEAAANDELSSTEKSYLTDIIEAARNDQWDESLAMSRQLMVDQLRP